MLLNPQLVDRIEAALDEIRPALESDGGTVELLDVTGDGVVRLSFVGACGGCPLSALTLKLGIERTVKLRVPEIRAVEAENAGEPSWLTTPV
jgi:Fe-S cluster biogenesis protein NfuA